jgi:serine/threonine protein kinase
MVPNLLGDRYEVGRLLGSGPAADVFEGWDRLLGRRIAIKVLRELLADDERILTGFRRAASSAAGLSHPGIVGTNDAEIDRAPTSW